MNPLQWDAPWLVVAGALFLIVMARANATYWLGRLALAGARRSRWSDVVDSPKYQRAALLIERWGPPAVTLSFLTIGIQTLVNLSAGAARMPMRRYLPAVTLGCMIWAGWYATVGVAGWTALAAVWVRSPALALGVGSALVVGLVWFVVRQLRTTA